MCLQSLIEYKCFTTLSVLKAMLHLFVFYIIPCYTLHYGVRAAVMQASEMIAHDITLHLMNYEHIILHYTSWIHHITLHLMNSGYTILQYIPWIIDTACVLQCFVSTRHLLVIRLSQFQSKKTVKMIICKRPTEQVRLVSKTMLSMYYSEYDIYIYIYIYTYIYIYMTVSCDPRAPIGSIQR